MTDLPQGTPQAAPPVSPAGQEVASPPTHQTATAEGHAQGAPERQTATRPTWIPETFWDAEKAVPKEKEFSEHLASLERLKVDTEARKGAIPATPEEYKVDLGDIKLPEGRELDTKDPRFVDLRKLAHEQGLTADAFNKFLQIEAKHLVEAEARNKATLTSAVDERNKLLGENGAGRVEALSTWLDAQFTDPKEASQVKATMWTPVIVKFFERIQQALANQGSHGFVQTGREPAPDDGKPNGWDKLSSLDRRTWQLQEARLKNAGM